MAKITIILNSGKEIVFKCENFTKHFNGNDLTGYEIKWGDYPQVLFYCKIDDISAILKD